jgi:hypothetical protein
MNLFFCWPTHFNCVLIFSGAPHEIHSTSGRFCPDVFPTCLSKSTYEIQLFSRSLKISIKITHEFHENPTFPRCLLLEFPGFSRIFQDFPWKSPRKSQEIPPFLHPKMAPKRPRNPLLRRHGRRLGQRGGLRSSGQVGLQRAAKGEEWGNLSIL